MEVRVGVRVRVRVRVSHGVEGGRWRTLEKRACSSASASSTPSEA